MFLNPNNFFKFELQLFLFITPNSGKDVGPTFINFGFFSRPYFLIKGHMFNDFCNSFRAQQTFSNLINFVCIFNISLHILFCRIFYFIVATHLELSFYQLRPYIYSFCQFFQALHVFFLPNFLGPIYILGPMFILFGKFSRPYLYLLLTSILESRVDMRNLLEQVKKHSVIKNCSDLSLFE